MPLLETKGLTKRFGGLTVMNDLNFSIDAISKMRDRGITVLVVEQNVHLAFGAADYCYTLQVGEMVAEGTVEEIRHNDVVKKAYFGG